MILSKMEIECDYCQRTETFPLDKWKKAAKNVGWKISKGHQFCCEKHKKYFNANKNNFALEA